MAILFTKLKRLKATLKEFNKHQFGELTKKVVDARNKLEEVQIRALNLHDVYDVELERKLSLELQDLLKAE
ncbi:hypothetical protein PTKIN_Ptkin11bG0037700 [Pterospermum kingtungense]